MIICDFILRNASMHGKEHSVNQVTEDKRTCRLLPGILGDSQAALACLGKADQVICMYLYELDFLERP